MCKEIVGTWKGHWRRLLFRRTVSTVAAKHIERVVNGLARWHRLGHRVDGTLFEHGTTTGFERVAPCSHAKRIEASRRRGCAPAGLRTEWVKGVVDGLACLWPSLLPFQSQVAQTLHGCHRSLLHGLLGRLASFRRRRQRCKRVQSRERIFVRGPLFLPLIRLRAGHGKLVELHRCE